MRELCRKEKKSKRKEWFCSLFINRWEQKNYFHDYLNLYYFSKHSLTLLTRRSKVGKAIHTGNTAANPLFDWCDLFPSSESSHNSYKNICSCVNYTSIEVIWTIELIMFKICTQLYISYMINFYINPTSRNACMLESCPKLIECTCVWVLSVLLGE